MNNEQIIINNNIHSNSYSCYNVRTSDTIYDRSDTDILFLDEKNISKTYSELENINVNIYRYKLSPHILQSLLEFSKLYQYNDRFEFKENWKQWLKEKEEMINIEEEKLKNLHYKGNIRDKMFKSARYYLRQKSTIKKEPQTRKSYIYLPKELLERMDTFLKNNKNKNLNIKPKDIFLEFCENHKSILKECILKIFNDGMKDTKKIQDKIKKTFKNRYFKLVQK